LIVQGRIKFLCYLLGLNNMHLLYLGNVYKFQASEKSNAEVWVELIQAQKRASIDKVTHISPGHIDLILCYISPTTCFTNMTIPG